MPGGANLWHYNDVCAMCGAGETKLHLDGTPDTSGPCPVLDAGAIKVGPGGPVSAACIAGMSTAFSASAVYTPCTKDTVCNACLTTDYADASCQTNKAFRDLFNFTCIALPVAACNTECGK